MERKRNINWDNGEYNINDYTHYKKYIIFIVLFTILIVIMFSGCSKKQIYPYIEMNGLVCECNNPSLYIKKDGGYECVCEGDYGNDKDIFNGDNASINRDNNRNSNIKLKSCPTEITKIYTKQNITICIGDILKEGQKSRIVRVDK